MKSEDNCEQKLKANVAECCWLQHRVMFFQLYLEYKVPSETPTLPCLRTVCKLTLQRMWRYRGSSWLMSSMVQSWLGAGAAPRVTSPCPSSDVREHSGYLKPALKKWLVLGLLSCRSAVIMLNPGWFLQKRFCVLHWQIFSITDLSGLKSICSRSSSKVTANL